MDKRHLAVHLFTQIHQFFVQMCLCWRLEVIFVWIFLLNLCPPVDSRFPLVIPEVNIEYCALRVDGFRVDDINTPRKTVDEF